MKSIIQSIEENIFAVGRYWGSLNYSVMEDGSIFSMITGIASGDLNWTWNEKHLAEKDAQIINKIKHNYEELKMPFWWWVYPCGKSKKTKEILHKEGFNYLDAIPCLAIDLSETILAAQKNNDLKISFVNDKRELKIWGDVSFAGFKMTKDLRKQYSIFVESFDLKESSPQKLFLAYFMGQPVATALLFMHKNIAGIYFVSTLAAHRKKGIALDLIMAAIKYAQMSGYKYCVLQSSKEGLNVYLQAGFKEYCRANVYSIPD